MPTETQDIALAVQSPVTSVLQLYQLAMSSERPQIEVMERLAVMLEREREYQAKVAFDDALNSCQKQIGRIAPNQKRNDTGAWWADYAQLDKTIRPIYTDAEFSVGYSEVEPLCAGKVRIKGTLSRSGISREYFSEITPSTHGPKGNAMATATDADAIAASRAKRYVLLSIFNIAIGLDKEEKAGIPSEGMLETVFAAHMEKIQGADTKETLQAAFLAATKDARDLKDAGAARSFEKAKNDTWRSNGGYR